MSRMDQYAVGVTIDGEDWGTWDKQDGGESTAEETKFNPGGMAPPVTLGGRRTIANVTISRLYDLAVVHTRVHSLLNKVGRARVVVTQQPLDEDRNAFGRPLVRTGKLIRVSPPSPDSESSAAAMIELEVSTSGGIG